jgi:L-seryl-tRNA(Ser) seleniumtransferase
MGKRRNTVSGNSVSAAQEKIIRPSTGGAPASAGLPGGSNTIVVGVWMLQPGEDVIVAKRLKEVLQGAVVA